MQLRPVLGPQMAKVIQRGLARELEFRPARLIDAILGSLAHAVIAVTLPPGGLLHWAVVILRQPG